MPTTRAIPRAGMRTAVEVGAATRRPGATAPSADQASRLTIDEALELVSTGPSLDDERFRTIIDSMLDAVYLISPVWDDDAVIDFRIDHANQAALQLMRGAFHDIVGHRLLDLAPAAGDLVGHYATVLETGMPFRREHVYEGELTQAGEVQVSFEVSALRLEDGLVVCCRDMGPKRAAEEAMRQSEERFRSLIQNSTDIILVIDPDSTVQYVSPAATRLLGYEPAAMEGTPALDLVHPDDLAAAAGVLATSIAEGGIAPPLRYRVRHADGSWRWMESIGNNLLGDPAVRAYVINARDVTDEEVVIRDLIATKELLAGITDNMAEGMVAIDRDGRFTFVNAAAERLLGWSESELVGLSSHDTIHCTSVEGERDSAAPCPLAGVIRRGESCRVEHDAFTRRDGTTFPVAFSASPLVTDAVSGAVIVFDDISERLTEQSRIDRELEKLSWVGRIRDALDEDRFVLYAQPILDLSSGEVVQHELLLRMLTADGDVVLPDSFLPTAEEFGLIAEIDRWVVTETARLAGLGHHVEFNLSTKSVVDPNMVDFICAALERAHADPSKVVCEITETALLNDAQAGEAFVEGLNAIGCQVALDDFGMGYGGFAYLKRLPVACLKIDREFVRDVHEVAASGHVVSAVVSLAKAFDLRTIAEGAEDLAVLDVLRELGVDCVQGYATGRPVPLDEAFPPPQTRTRSGVGGLSV